MTPTDAEDAVSADWRAHLEPLGDHLVDLLPALCVVARDHETPDAGAQDAVAVSPYGDCVLVSTFNEPVDAVSDGIIRRWAWFAEHASDWPARYPAAGFEEPPQVHAVLLAPAFAPRLLRALESSPLDDLRLIRFTIVGDDGAPTLLVQDALAPARSVFGTPPAPLPVPDPGLDPGADPPAAEPAPRPADVSFEREATGLPEIAAFRSLRPLDTAELASRCAHRMARLDPALAARRDGNTTRFVLARRTVATLLERADHLELAVPGRPPFALRAADDMEPALLSATRRYFELLAPTQGDIPRRGLSTRDLVDDA